MAQQDGHVYGQYESRKFDYRREGFYEYIKWLDEKKLNASEILDQAPAFLGHMHLNRMLTIYELYRKTLGIAGHIADVGVYKGYSSLLFAKLVKIFENESLTMVHGFDWFEGNSPTSEDPEYIKKGGYKSDYDEVLELIKIQNLDNILKIHKMDLTKDCPAFFEEHKHLKFKLVMMDAGLYEVMKNALPYFWDRLCNGGVMIFDQYSHEFAPGETLAINEIIPNAVVRTIPNSWMPNAYVVKGE